MSGQPRRQPGPGQLQAQRNMAMRLGALGRGPAAAGQQPGQQRATVQVRFDFRRGALGAGNDVEKGMHTLQEAMVRCAALPDAVGFTYFGPPNPGPAVKLEVFFKKSGEGNDDPQWSTFIKAQPLPADDPIHRFVGAVTKNRTDEALSLLSAHAGRVDPDGRHQFVTARNGNGGWCALGIAAWHGHVDMMRIVLRAGAPINMATGHGETPLYLAAQHGQMEAAKLLLESRADTSLANSKGATAICVAAEQGHEAVTRLLVEEGGMSVHGRLVCGSNVLWLAAKGGHSGVVTYLLSQNAEMAANMDGQTPIHIACTRGHHVTLGVLLRATAADGAPSEPAADGSEDTRVSRLLRRMASSRDRARAAVFELAVAEQEVAQAREEALTLAKELAGSANADAERLWEEHREVSAAARAAREGIVAVHGHKFDGGRLEEKVGEHLQKVAAASEPSATAPSAADAAAPHDPADPRIVAAVNALNSRGESPLFAACAFAFEIPKDNSKESVVPTLSDQELHGLLQQHKLAVRAQDRQALVEAVLSNVPLSQDEVLKLRDVQKLRSAQLATVNALLAAGAEFDTVTPSGHTPLFMACQRGGVEAARALILAGADTSLRPQPAGLHLLYIASYGGFLPVVQLLCEEANADVDEQTGQHHFTALMPAAQQGHLDVIEFLHQRGADPDITNDAGATALLFAGKFDRVEAAAYLINEMGAAPDGRGAGQPTPLYAAAENGHVRVAKVLIDAKGDVNVTKSNGATPLLTATENGHVDMALLLVDNGADPSAELTGCKSGIMTIAAMHGRTELLEVLIRRFPALDPLKPNANGATTLHLAATQGHLSTVKALLNNTTADTLDLDGHRRTSLKLAVLAQKVDVAEFLLEYSAAVAAGRRFSIRPGPQPRVYSMPELSIEDDGGSVAASSVSEPPSSVPKPGSLAAEAAELLDEEDDEPEPERDDSGESGAAASAGAVDAVVAKKTRWLRAAIDAFMPHRPRVILTSPRANILATLPRSGFQAQDLRGGLDVAFQGSDGRGDGMRREWLELISAEFMDANVNLFRSRDGGRTFDPSPTAALTNEDHLLDLRVVGRVVGVALLHGECMRHALFSEPLLNQLLGLPLTPQGVEAIDPVLYKNKIRPILELSPDCDEDEAELWLDGLTFTVTTDPDTSPCYFGASTTHELCPGGASKPVTLENKGEYIELLSTWYQRTETEPEITALLQGVREVLHPSVLRAMGRVITAQELLVLIAGEHDRLPSFSRWAVFTPVALCCRARELRRRGLARAHGLPRLCRRRAAARLAAADPGGRGAGVPAPAAPLRHGLLQRAARRLRGDPPAVHGAGPDGPQRVASAHQPDLLQPAASAGVPDAGADAAGARGCAGNERSVIWIYL